MNLKPLKVKEIVLKVFGEEGGETMDVDGVKFKVKTVKDKIIMGVLCIPRISAQVSTQNGQYVLSENYSHS